MTAQPDFSLIVGYGTDMGNAEDAAMSFCEALEEANNGPSAEAITAKRREAKEAAKAAKEAEEAAKAAEAEAAESEASEDAE